MKEGTEATTALCEASVGRPTPRSTTKFGGKVSLYPLKDALLPEGPGLSLFATVRITPQL